MKGERGRRYNLSFEVLTPFEPHYRCVSCRTLYPGYFQEERCLNCNGTKLQIEVWREVRLLTNSIILDFLSAIFPINRRYENLKGHFAKDPTYYEEIK